MTNFKQQVTDYLNGHIAICEEFMREDACGRGWIKEGVFDYTGVYHYGGEDMGSDYYVVIVIRNPDNHDEKYYIKFQGWYVTSYGAEYESWSFIEPKQKTITVYS